VLSGIDDELKVASRDGCDKQTLLLWEHQRGKYLLAVLVGAMKAPGFRTNDQIICR
jgi:hypothetical protein